MHLATYSGMLAAASLSSVMRGEITAEEAATFYSTCYLRWMILVSTFYDQNAGKESYFREAQRLSTGDLNAADAKLVFTHVVAGIEDLKEARRTELLAEVSMNDEEPLVRGTRHGAGADRVQVRLSAGGRVAGRGGADVATFRRRGRAGARGAVARALRPTSECFGASGAPWLRRGSGVGAHAPNCCRKIVGRVVVHEECALPHPRGDNARIVKINTVS